MNVPNRSDHAREDMVVARLQQLAPHLDGEPDPAFRTATRARLVAMAAVRTPAPEPVTGLKRLLAWRADVAPTRWRGRLTAGLAGGAMAVTVMATLVAVSTDAQPGDVLYGVKRGTEQGQLALAGDARGRTLLDFASTRLDELERLVDDGPAALPVAPAGNTGETVLAAAADPGLILDTLRAMDDQTTQGAEWLTVRAVNTENLDPLEDLAVWAAEQSSGLTALRPLLPAEAEVAAAGSLTLLTHIDSRVTGLRGAMGCASGPAVIGTDPLGPIPGPCPPPETVAPGTGGDSGGTGGSAGTGTQPAPGAGSAPIPQAPTTAAVPQPGGGPGTGPTAGGGSGGSLGGPEVPSVEVPTPSVPSLPPPPVPLPPPSISLPGGDGPATGSSPGSPAGSPPSLTVCLPPLEIGDC